ncbi:conserved oligomeric Golgi complex subunit 2 [Sitophilus oryzae]|uniref:Conserved oligomeric Golgi complex subunit 2 n=1 Tax=Sitophilus oryzae TaxID=7048 RepID=A0A6J2XZ33_SITOR|nr:conserved oligomeric Golgi complex subunit 2 [Sitophilus oryzae]
MDTVEEASWKETFFKTNFSVDQSLADFTQKTDLESLRRYLKSYGTELQLEMSDILKNETEAIVNLAEYLTNLNSKIDNLSIPISQLSEEIKNLYELIKSVEGSFDSMMSEIKNNNLKQNHIHLKLGIVSSCLYVNLILEAVEKDLYKNLDTLERIVNKFSFQKVYLCELSLLTPEIQQISANVEEKLVANINKCLLSGLKDEDKDILLKCLRMYVNLQKEQEAYNTFQLNILRPELQPLFTQRYLERSGQDLEKIYSEVRAILHGKTDLLSEIIKENPELCSFNFILKSFWVEFDKQSTAGLSYITAPGNPELFQKRFISTFKLIKYIAEKSGNKDLVSKDESFQNNLKRFNLPVYFEIKFQQIAGNFESEIYNTSLNNIYLHNNDHFCTLKPSLALFKATQSCFHSNVYIDQLADQFIKLSLMLLSRYIKLIDQVRVSIPVETDKEQIDNFIIHCLFDLNAIGEQLAPRYRDVSDVDKTIFSIVNQNIWNILPKVFQQNEKVILSYKLVLEEYLIDTKNNECNTQLQNVTAIPRLYRRTNRNPPKEASAYMVNTVKPILHFYDKFRPKLGQELDEILNKIIIKTTDHYLSLVQEVLSSVCKTEESLRRLKSRALNKTSNDEMAQHQTDTITDETKIREQIKYDVGYFCDKFYPLAIPSTRQAMETLKREVCK